MPRYTAAGGVTVALLAWGPVVAQEPLVTDRPDFTESATLVQPGRVQAEGGYTFAREDDTDVHTIGELLLRIGVIERVEARVGLDSWTIVRAADESAGGLADVSLGAKLDLWRGRDRTAIPDAALLASTSLPTGSDDVGAERTEPEIRLALAWSLAERVSLGTNVFYVRRDVPELLDRNDLGYSAALGFALTEAVGLFCEGFVVEDGPYADAGVTYGLSPDLQLDARIGAELSHPRDRYFAGVGMAFRW